jgi:RHS repeat-associated protein
MYATYPPTNTPSLFYAMNRHYSSQVMRFTSPDPYMSSAGPADPQSWNRYAYVQGDPVNNMDPTGLASISSIFGWLGSIWSELGSPEGPPAYWNISFIHRRLLTPFRPVPDELTAGSAGDPFSDEMRKKAAAAINGMAKPCKDALGAKWNIFSGDTSLLYKVDENNPNAVNFRDGTNPAVAATPMTAWGGNSSETTGEYLSTEGRIAFVSSYNGRISSTVVLGGAFFSETPIDQSRTLIHEVLHSYTGLGDLDLAFKMGLGGFVRPQDASRAINLFFSSDCDMKKYNGAMGR